MPALEGRGLQPWSLAFVSAVAQTGALRVLRALHMLGPCGRATAQPCEHRSIRNHVRSPSLKGATQCKRRAPRAPSGFCGLLPQAVASSVLHARGLAAEFVRDHQRLYKRSNTCIQLAATLLVSIAALCTVGHWHFGLIFSVFHLQCSTAAVQRHSRAAVQHCKHRAPRYCRGPVTIRQCGE